MLGKSLRDYKNSELLEILQKNEVTDLQKLSGICSEILRRINEKFPLLEEDQLCESQELIYTAPKTPFPTKKSTIPWLGKIWKTKKCKE